MLPDELAALTRAARTRVPTDDARRSTARAIETLADLPPLRDRLLFVGLNPSPVSVEAGHYHQGRLGQTFWRRLMTARVLPPGTPIETADDALVAAGHGITDLLKLPTAARRGDRRGPDRGRRAALAEDRDLAAGRGRVHLQARRLDLAPVGRWPNRGASCRASRWPAGRAS